MSADFIYQIEMNFDIILDKQINKNSLKEDFEQLPQSIYAALTSFSEPFLFLETNLTIIFINARANEIIKLISGNYAKPGDNILNFVKIQHQNTLNIFFKKIVTGKSVHHEIEVPTANSSIWLDCNCKPVFNGQSISGVSAIIKDITHEKKLDASEIKRKEAEEKEFQNKLLFETFMENTSLISWISDDKGMMHYLNPTFRKLYNLPLNKHAYNMYEIFSKELADEYFENNLLAISSGKVIEVVERTLKPDGTMAIYKVFKFPLHIGDQLFIGGWSMEITEETRLQEQLTSAMERYNYVNEATSDAIYDWDTETNILYRGKGFAILFGYHDAYVPLDFRFSRVHPDDVSEVKKTYLESLEDVTLR